MNPRIARSVLLLLIVSVLFSAFPIARFLAWTGLQAGPGRNREVASRPGLRPDARLPNAAFTSGNLVVYRVGNGSGSLLNTGNPVFLDEFTSSGALVQSIALPTLVNGANRRLIASGTATSEGQISRSADGRFILATGYDAPTPTTGLAGTTATAVNRVVARVDAAGNVDTSTALTDGSDTNNPRGATSADGTTIWFTGGAGGIRATTFGTAGTSTQLSTTVTNLRSTAIFNGQLYVSTSSGSAVRVGTVGTGTPTTSGQTISNLPGFPTAGSPNGYFFADLSPSVAGVDTLYVAEDTTGGGQIQKYSLVSGNWTANGTITASAVRGLTGIQNGGNVTLYGTTGGSGATGGGSLYSFTDTTGYNATVSGTVSTIATAATNTAFRGVALAPVSVVSLPDLTISNSGPSTATTSVSYAYTLTVANIGTANASGVMATFTLPAGVTFNSASGANGFTASQSAGVVTFSGGTVNAGSNAILTVNVTAGSPSVVVSAVGAAVVDPSNTISESNESNNSSTTSVTTTVSSPANTPPTIAANTATTTPLLRVSANGPAFVSAVFGDTSDPAANFGIDFTVADGETPAGSLTVTATSGNQAVIPNVNLNLTGITSTRNLKFTPVGVGYATVTVTVSDGTFQASYVVNLAVSSGTGSTARYLTDTSDGSSAIAVDANFMFVADDENQALRLYRRGQSGLPVTAFDYTSSLGLTDFSGGLAREVDLEASTRIGNRLYWLGSESNAASGNARPNRNRLYATDLSGTGASATLTYVGRYDSLKNDLIAWDQNNLHGLGANFFGLAASAATGVIPEAPDGSGYNIEGLTIAPDNSTAYIGFRAPIVPGSARTRALIVPVTNFQSLVTGNPAAGPAQFGPPIQLDLGGRGIRSIDRNAAGQYLIIAGPPDSATGVAPKDFRLYSWTGFPADLPVLRAATFPAGQSPEGVVEVPNPLTDSSVIQYVSDDGDTVLYNDGVIAKDLVNSEFKKFRTDSVTLGAVVTPPNINGSVSLSIQSTSVVAVSSPCAGLGYSNELVINAVLTNLGTTPITVGYFQVIELREANGVPPAVPFRLVTDTATCGGGGVGIQQGFPVLGPGQSIPVSFRIAVPALRRFRFVVSVFGFNGSSGLNPPKRFFEPGVAGFEYRPETVAFGRISPRFQLF